MYLGKVIGNIWATRKNPQLRGFKLMIVQPINSELHEIGDPIVAVDTIGSGTGDYIFYISSSEAVIPLPVETAPVDASIIGIVDTVYTE